MPRCDLAASLRVRVVAGLEAGACEGGAGRGGEGGVVPPRRPGDGGQLLGRRQGQGQGQGHGDQGAGGGEHGDWAAAGGAVLYIPS